MSTSLEKEEFKVGDRFLIPAKKPWTKENITFQIVDEGKTGELVAINYGRHRLGPLEWTESIIWVRRSYLAQECREAMLLRVR